LTDRGPVDLSHGREGLPWARRRAVVHLLLTAIVGVRLVR